MEVTFLSVGYGECIVVHSENRCIVIDGGPADPTVYTHPNTISLLDFLKAKQVSEIDLMICTHLHQDHIAGLVSVAHTMAVKEFWCNCLPEGCVSYALNACAEAARTNPSLSLFRNALAHYDELRRELEAQGTKMVEVGGEKMPRNLWGELSIQLYGLSDAERIAQRTALEQVLCETDSERVIEGLCRFDAAANKGSLAMRISKDCFGVFLTGDLVAGWEQRCQNGMDDTADVLKLTHHGQHDGMPEALVKCCDPSAFVICTDQARTFHSACDSVCARAEAYLREHGRAPGLYITGDLCGNFRAKEPICAVAFRKSDSLHAMPILKSEVTP